MEVQGNYDRNKGKETEGKLNRKRINSALAFLSLFLMSVTTKEKVEIRYDFVIVYDFFQE
jgi:hypothetical protein